MARKKQSKKHNNKSGGRKQPAAKVQQQQQQQQQIQQANPPEVGAYASPPKPPPPNESSSAPPPVITATAAAEKRLIAELYTLSRSLLASLPGCAPDGSPLALPDHPLARLHAQLMDKVSELMALQRERASVRASTCNKANTDAGENSSSSSSSSITDRDNPKAWSTFLDWLNACGIQLGSDGAKDCPVEIRKSTVAAASTASDGEEENEDEEASLQPNNQEYGLFATRDLAYGEVVLKIPIDAMMCPYFDHVLTSKSVSSPVPPPPFDANRPLEQDLPLRPLCLITYLANERYRGRDSVFAPYLDTLPASSPTPLYWSVEEMRRSLALTSHLKRAVMMQAKLVWDYIQAREIIDETHKESSSPIEGLIPTRDFTFELFRWSTVTAHTRQNLIPHPVASSRRGANSAEGNGGDIEQAHGLVPLWDIINHEDSDRACRTDCEFADNTVDGAQIPSKGYLICHTPSNRPKGNVPCFHAGEEITMYYGARSNAQLLFNSGFVNCAEDITSSILSADEERLGSENGATPTSHRFNRNRTDCALLRLALPPAAKDSGLDRIREMIAARFGFRAFSDQGSTHDGLEAAEAAAKVIEAIGTKVTDTKTTNDESAPKTAAAGTSLRKATEVVMIEVNVSATGENFFPNDLRNALLLCIANKEELTNLLRNMDLYTRDEEGEPQELLKLGEKHLTLAEELVKVQLRRRRKNQESIDLANSRDRVSLQLALCDEETLSAWLNSFRSSIHASIGNTNEE